MQLRAAIRNAHDVGLTVLIKPHVWVPGNWAGTVVMKSEQAWQKWFANYRREIAAHRAYRRGGKGRRARDRHRTRTKQFSGRNGTT